MTTHWISNFVMSFMSKLRHPLGRNGTLELRMGACGKSLMKLVHLTCKFKADLPPLSRIVFPLPEKSLKLFYEVDLVQGSDYRLHYLYTSPLYYFKTCNKTQVSADYEGEVQSVTPEKLQYIPNQLHYFENLYVKCLGNMCENKS